MEPNNHKLIYYSLLPDCGGILATEDILILAAKIMIFVTICDIL